MHLPSKYREKDGPWPLIVFLHGSGESGNDPTMLQEFSFVESTGELPAIVAAPQCLPTSGWDPEAVVRFIKYVAATYRVDRRRICVVGNSMGGYGTWHTAEAHPELFAAVVPICGGGDPTLAARLANVPIWAFHGEKDEAVPIAESESMVEKIRAAGGSPKFTVIPNAGHGICQSVCSRSDLWDWVFRQLLPSRSNGE